jgi:hypothetical protein
VSFDDQVEVIARRMFRNRFDQWKQTHRGWHQAEMNVGGKRLNCRDVIRKLLEKGYKVTAGYYPTACRGFHTYMVLWKEKGRIRAVKYGREV